MGAERNVSSDQHQGISFVLGSDKIYVTIVRPDDLAHRNAILETLLNLSALRHTYQLLYLVAPRLFGATIDASIFRSRGIGLLLYDERRIDQALPAQPLQIQQATAGLNDSIVTELATLKTLYHEMERTISQLRNDLATVRNLDPVHERDTRIPIPTGMLATQPDFPRTVTQGAELPSYFMNNPWLDVLSKRGVGEHEPIAG